MDDTVIVATSRRKCLQKLSVVMDYCYKYGMEINLKKSKYFVINAEERDKIPLVMPSLTIYYSSHYLCLGAWFTDSASPKDTIKLHETKNQATVN